LKVKLKKKSKWFSQQHSYKLSNSIFTMHLPDYKGGSIVNLMSSIQQSYGKKHQYIELKSLSSTELKSSKNVVLLVLDGLGYDYVLSKESTLNSNLRGKMDSVFPPTTAAAVTTYVTGLAPRQHALTGWFINLKEIGVVSAVLPFVTRSIAKSISESKYDISIDDILGVKGFTEDLPVKSYAILEKKISGSDYTKSFTKKSDVVSCVTIKGFFSKIKKVVKKNNKKKYVYAYWSKFDTYSHKYGKDSEKTFKHFKEIDQALEGLVKSIKGTNTTLIITADHGQVVSKKSERIDLKNHPKLQECLSLPVCGEPRAAQCYVYPSKAKEFEKYVKTKMKKYCELYTREQTLKDNWYGLYKSNAKFFHRIGDYVLITKGKYIIKDNILGRDAKFDIGNHGGITKEEIEVPLIVINC
jgi:hypothetical protein